MNVILVISIFLAVWSFVLITGKLIRGNKIAAWTIIIFAASTTVLICKAIGMW